MKKNKLFRLLTVALALVFICQFAVPAFAYTSSSWSDGSSDYYLEAYTNGSRTVEDAIIPNTFTYHYYGGHTGFNLYYDLTANEDWRGTSYQNELLDALEGDYSNYLYIPAVNMTDDCGGIPASEATGKYNIRVDTYYKRIGYFVYQEYYGAQNLWDSGEVLAPTGFSDLISGYAYAEPI